MILLDLERTWVGKLTYLRASYCAQLLRILESEEGAYCRMTGSTNVYVNDRSHSFSLLSIDCTASYLHERGLERAGARVGGGPEDDGGRQKHGQQAVREDQELREMVW